MRRQAVPLSGYLAGQGGPATPSGTVALVAGAATVSTAKITANSRIFLTHQSPAGTLGALYVNSRTPGTSFAIASLNVLDTSTVAWMIIEP